MNIKEIITPEIIPAMYECNDGFCMSICVERDFYSFSIKTCNSMQEILPLLFPDSLVYQVFDMLV